MNFAIDVPTDLIFDQLFGSSEMQKRSPFEENRRKSPGGSDGAGATSSQVAFGLVENALLTHQAMVKIVPNGGIKKAGGLAKQLAYISRQGGVELERGSGAAPHDLEAAQSAVVSDWERDFSGADPRTKQFTYHMILSYPKGTDDLAAKIAAREFAERLTDGAYGDRYKYIIAHHRDTANPHAHIILNRLGAEGQTLHISRHAITTQDLRELHVETARDAGIRLNATSRFSRGINRRADALGRVKSSAEGREIASRPDLPKRGDFPFYGAGRRAEPKQEVLEMARVDNIETYKRVAAEFRKSPATVAHRVAGQIEKAASYLTRGKELTREEYGMDLIETPRDEQKEMAAQREAVREGREAEKAGKPVIYVHGRPYADPSSDDQGSGSIYEPKSIPEVERVDPNVEIASINNDLKQYLDAMASKVEALPEENRTTAETAFSAYLSEMEPLLDDSNRKHFGSYLEQDTDQDREQSPALQRKEAELDIEKARTGGVSQSQNVDRFAAGKDHLSKTDKDVMKHFADKGLNGKLAVERIMAGAGVDKQTRKQWFDRDVQSHANANNLSDTQARKELTDAYGQATLMYRNARTEIQSINRGERDEDIRAAQASIAEKAQAERVDSPKSEDRSGSKSSDVGAKSDEIKDGRFSITGVVREFGEMLYKPDDPYSMSPYVQIEKDDGTRRNVFGVAMPDVQSRYNLNPGDRCTLTNIGKEEVQVKERDPKTGEIREKIGTRRAWEATDIKREGQAEKIKSRQERERQEEKRGTER